MWKGKWNRVCKGECGGVERVRGCCRGGPTLSGVIVDNLLG